MEKEEFDKLGFTEEISWENEDSEKQALFEKIAKLKAKAAENYNLREEFKKQSELPHKNP
ncbi:MAG: hypothetical protein H6620_12220 [Halobacteriovoraceae bacterium]|nr:hypothetical protein [Halobacteriovoraceae bacterium]